MNVRQLLIASAIASLGAAAWAQGSATSATPNPTTPAAPAASTVTIPAQKAHETAPKLKHARKATADKAAHAKAHDGRAPMKGGEHKLKPARHQTTQPVAPGTSR